MRFPQQILSLLVATAALQSCATNPNQAPATMPANQAAIVTETNLEEEDAFLYRSAAMSGVNMREGGGGAARAGGGGHGR